MELANHLSLTVYTFRVGDTVFKISAQNVVDAYKAANCKIREDRLVRSDELFAWFDTTTTNTFRLGRDVFLD
jgi:hypothetical protein